MRWRSIVALGVLSTFGALGCDGQGPDVGLLQELQRNRLRWAAQAPSSYTYAIERLCFCGGEARGPVRVAVTDGVVAERVYVESGDPVSPSFADLFPAVEGLFDVIADAIARDAFRIDVMYDADTGVPLDISIDYEQHVADEELGFRVTETVSAVTP